MTAERPPVSAVIATYNGQAFLAQTLDSVLAQTWRPLEVVVVNDGSTDGTAALLERYADRVTVLHQENGGVSQARNAGAQLARGQLLAFIDHDDMWEPDMLERQVALLQQNADCGLAYADSWIIDRHGEVQGRRCEYLSYKHGHVYTDLLRGNFIPIETAVMPAELFHQLGGFDVRLRYLEDYELYLRLAARWPVAHQPHPVARYRIHESNLSHDLEALLTEWVQIQDRMLAEAWTRAPAERKILVKERARRCAEVAWQALRRGDLAACNEWSARVGKGCPWLLCLRLGAWRALLAALPSPWARHALRLLPRRRLYGL